MIDWREFSLNDVCSRIYSGGTPNTQNASFWGGEIPWLSSGETRQRFIFDTEKTITIEGVNNSSTKLAKKNSIVIASAGQGHTRGQTSFLEFDTYINQSVVCLEPDINRIYPLWLFYNLSNRYDEMRRLSDGHSSRGSLTTVILKEMKLKLPSMSNQKSVSEFLYSLDQKIELNQRMNETLEGMARSIFKSWFVDFDPVHAKAEGRQPEGMDAETAALFPSTFTPDGLPDGWKKKLVGDAVDTISKTYPLKKVDEVIFLNTGDILDGKFLHTNKSDPSTLPGQAKKSIQKGDILYSEIRPQNKRYAYVYFDAPDYVVSTKLMVLRAKADIPSIFVYFILTEQFNIDFLQMMAESRSGTFPQITFDVLSRVDYIGPIDNGVINIFAKNVLEPIYEKMIANEKQNQTLAALRDTLLPKLISGELRVEPATEKLKEAVG